MAKLALLLSLLAGGLAAFAAFRSPASSTAATGGTEGGVTEAALRDVREAKTLARKEADARLAEVLTAQVDKRIVRLDELRKQFEHAIAEARRLGEASADSVGARVDGVERDARQAVKGLRTDLESLDRIVAGLRNRPASGGSAEPPSKPPDPHAVPLPDEEPPEDAGTPTPAPTPVPTPAAPTMTEAERKEIDKALADLGDSDITKVFSAIEMLRRRKAKEAFPQIVKILGTHKNELVRMAAATALGGLGLADGVDALIEALVDDDASVAQQASKSLRQITAFDLDISAKAGIRERRKARSDMKQWWKDHEQEVRERLGQPKAAPGG